MQAGAVAVVLAVTTFNAFELDRFFVPKELALHITALFAAAVALRCIRRVTRVDFFLAAYLILSAISALLATNHWLALRALAISASSALIFWAARGLRTAGLDRRLLNGLALAIVIAVVTSLLQAYGVSLALFSEARAPGGTLGNRNFVAHIAAFGMPLVILAALRARSGRGYLAGSAGVMLAVAALVLTRSRAAWLAFAVVIVVFVVATLSSAAARRDARNWRRMAGVFAFAAAGVAAALVLPNALRWRSDNPYLQSVKTVADYQEGSGRGRLVQYERSLLMSLRHPLLGVGPGNWPVEYPALATRNDPSLNDSEPGTTLNPWPSSDVIASISERGVVATVLLALVFLGIAASAWKQLGSARESDEALRAIALLDVLCAAVVAGLFDAVLLTAAPALLVWAAAGTLYDGSPASGVAPQESWPYVGPYVWVVALIAVVISASGVVRSSSQLISMHAYVRGGGRSALEPAAAIDPGNYRLQLRLARMGGRARCEHARAALGLMPHATAAISGSRGCK